MSRKFQQGAMKYDVEEVAELEEFGPEEKVVIVNKTNKKRGGGIGVALRSGESIDSLLKRFKKSVIQSNILTEYHESLVFVKPSVKKRQKKISRKFKARIAERNKY